MQRPPHVPLAPQNSASSAAAATTTAAAAAAAAVTAVALATTSSMASESMHALAAPAPRRAQLLSPSYAQHLKPPLGSGGGGGGGGGGLALTAVGTPSPELERSFSPDLSAYFSSLQSPDPSVLLMSCASSASRSCVSVSTTSAPPSACSSATSSAGADSCSSGILSASASSSDGGDGAFRPAGSDGAPTAGDEAALEALACSGISEQLFEELNGPITESDLSHSPLSTMAVAAPAIPSDGARTGHADEHDGQHQQQQEQERVAVTMRSHSPGVHPAHRKGSRTATAFTFQMTAPIQLSPSPSPEASPEPEPESHPSQEPGAPSASERSPDQSLSRPVGRPPYPLAQISVGGAEAAAAAVAASAAAIDAGLSLGFGLDATEIQPPWPPAGTNFSLSTGSRSRRLSRSGNQVAAEEMHAASSYAYAHAAQSHTYAHSHSHSYTTSHTHTQQSRSQNTTPVLSSSSLALTAAGWGVAGGTSTPGGGGGSLTSSERRALYVSSDPGVRFVSSYTAATSSCMKASQLAARNPALVGKLLRYFIAAFVRKYFSSVLSFFALILALETAGARWLWSWSPLLFALLLIRAGVVVRSRVTVELRPGVPLRHMSFFKHARLLARAKLLPVARLYGNSCYALQQQQPSASGPGGAANSGTSTPCTPGSAGGGSSNTSSGGGSGGQNGLSSSLLLLGAEGVLSLSARQSAAHVAALAADILFQPSEGYCGHASLNNLLGSLAPPHVPQPIRAKMFLALPEIVRPFELREMGAFVREVVRASGVLASAVEKVECLYGWDDHSSSDDGGDGQDDGAQCAHGRGTGYSGFMGMVSAQLNDPRYRFMANFLRTPLFFCEEDQRMLQHLRSPSGGQPGAASLATGVSPSPLHNSPIFSPQPSAASSSAISSATTSSTSSSSSSAPPVSLGRKLFSGHWSPLIGWLEPAEVERVMMQRGGSATPQHPGASTYAYPASPAGAKLICRSSPLRNVMTRGVGLSERMERLSSGGGGGGTGSQAGSGSGGGGSGTYVPGSPINERGSRDSSATTPEDECDSSGASSVSSTSESTTCTQATTTTASSATLSASPSPPRVVATLTHTHTHTHTRTHQECGTHSPPGSLLGAAATEVAASSTPLPAPTAAFELGSAASSGLTGMSSNSGSSSTGLRSRAHYSSGSFGSFGSFGSSVGMFPPPSSLSRSSSHSSSTDVAHTHGHTHGHAHGHGHSTHHAHSSSSMCMTSGSAATVAATTTAPSATSSSVADRVSSPWGSYSPNPFLTPTPRTGGGGSGSAVPPLHPLERASISEGLCLVADVNPSYAHYLVPPRRLYEAINTINLLDGAPRGIIRITLKSAATATATATATAASH